jgi:hypothetical protein
LKSGELSVLLELNSLFQIVSKPHEKPCGSAESTAHSSALAGSAYLIANDCPRAGTPACAEESACERFIRPCLGIRTCYARNEKDNEETAEPFAQKKRHRESPHKKLALPTIHARAVSTGCKPQLDRSPSEVPSALILNS